jgi:hypothetical protein
MEKLHFASMQADTALAQTGVLGLLGHVNIGAIVSVKFFKKRENLIVSI